MRNGWVAGLALALAVPVCGIAQSGTQQGTRQAAQKPTKPTRTITRITTGQPSVRGTRNVRATGLNTVCAELASSPSALVRAPEGRALLRFRKDLEGAAVAMEQRGEAVGRGEAQRMAEVRRGLDSLMQVMVRTMTDEHGKERTIVTLHSRGGASGGGAMSGGGASAGGGPGNARADLESRLVRGQVEATIRSMEPEIAALMGAAVSRAAVRIPMPTGWMGVTLSKSARDVPSPEGMLTYNCDYPVIEAVQAGSPAEKGGLLAGDTLLAYNGRDVRADAVNLTRLLVPKRVVRVRVNRGGRVREVPITIAARADEGNVAFIRSLCPAGTPRCDARTFSFEIDTVRGARFEVSPSRGSASGASGSGALGRPGTVGRVFISSTPVAPAPPVDAMLRGTGMAVILGAQLSVIDDEFAQGAGVEPGVLVLKVIPGTPMYEAGVRPSEILRAVNGIPLREMQPLRRALETSSAREVKLTVSGRERAPRIVVVRW